MISLNPTQNRVRDDNRPQHAAVNAVNNKQYTANKIYEPYFFQVFQDKAQYNKKRGGIANVTCSFWTHTNDLGGQI